MEPIELALKVHLDLSPISYLERTHDARVYDIAFDGKTLMLTSESWVATDPISPGPGQRFRPIFSRYRATFTKAENLQVEALDAIDPTVQPLLADFMQDEIRDVIIALPSVTISTDEHELRFYLSANRHRAVCADS